MFVCCKCCVLSGRGLCDELITFPEECYGLCCVVVCDIENLMSEEAMTRVGSQRHRKKKWNKLEINLILYVCVCVCVCVCIYIYISLHCTKIV